MSQSTFQKCGGDDFDYCMCVFAVESPGSHASTIHSAVSSINSNAGNRVELARRGLGRSAATALSRFDYGTLSQLRLYPIALATSIGT